MDEAITMQDRDEHFRLLDTRIARLKKLIGINAPDKYIAIECALIFKSGCVIDPQAAGETIANSVANWSRAGWACVECGGEIAPQSLRCAPCDATLGSPEQNYETN